MQSENATNDGQKKIGAKELSTRENGAQNSPSPGSDKQLLKPQRPETSQNLPESVSVQLVDLMRKVVASEVNPTTVRAACECARVINELLKTNLEMIRRGL